MSSTYSNKKGYQGQDPLMMLKFLVRRTFDIFFKHR